MRALLLGALVLLGTPAAAQDHAGHASSATSADTRAKEKQASKKAAGQMNHGTMPMDSMDHGSMPMGGMDHTGMDQPAMPMGAVDSGSSDQAAMGHAIPMDSAPTDHAAMGHMMPMDHSSMTAPAPPASGPPPRAFDGPAHAADAAYGAGTMAAARKELANENGGMPQSTFMLDRLEAQVAKGEDRYVWDAQGWYGGDIDKLWLKSEGEGAFGGKVDSAEVQALWSHAIGPWFDLQSGVRYDLEPTGRAHAVLGVEGLAPYMFDVEAAAFLSDQGDLTARLKAEYDQRITQRLILQPRFEASIAAQDIPAIGIGSGVSSVAAGLRLRYQIVREFAPYVGVEYEGKLGRTADFAHVAGESAGRLSLLLGVRAWF